MTFDRKIRDLLGQYAHRHNIGGGYSNKYKRSYPHILTIEGPSTYNSQAEVIVSQNVLASAKGKILMPEGKWQSEAHHLNSSQVMCYNLFRPMMNDDGILNSKGISFFANVMNIGLHEDAAGQFEYEDQSPDWAIDREGRATNFDFHVQDGETEVFIEVKYTEKNFGKATHYNDTKYAFYIKKAKEVLGLDMNTETLKDDYQLVRNAIRISEHAHTVFLYPAANDTADIECQQFVEKISEVTCPLKKNIHIVHLEDCLDYLDEAFLEKYLCYRDR